jgi:O-antigen ligase
MTLVVASVVITLIGLIGINLVADEAAGLGLATLEAWGKLALGGELDGDWWRIITTQFVYDTTGYEVAALAAIAIFGTLLERRHGWWAPLLLFVVGGGAGMALVVALDEGTIAIGGNAAALAMVAERPLLGFGWSSFREHNGEYFPLLEDVPQTAQRRLGIHNVVLTFATELGLIGATLFVLSFLLAVGRGVLTRGPPELRPWRIGLLAIALFWGVVAMFAPLGQVLPTLIPWLWAGIVVGPVLLPDTR